MRNKVLRLVFVAVRKLRKDRLTGIFFTQKIP